MTTETDTAQDEPVMTYDSTDEAAQEAPAAEPAAEETSEGAEAAGEAAEGRKEASKEGSKAPKKGHEALQKRFSDLTSTIKTERQLREEAERRAEAALELVKSMGGDPEKATPAKNLTAEDIRKQARAEIEAEAATKAFNQRADEVYQAGVNAFPDFKESIGELQMIGVLSPERPEFLAAVMETDSPEKVLNHLGQDVDEAARLAKLPPIKQAVELAKLAVKLNTPAPKPPKPVSRAPEPIAPITGTTQRNFDPLNEDDARQMTDAEWAEAMDKRDAAKRKREAERGY